MAIRMVDDTMTLKFTVCVVATARFSEHAAADCRLSQCQRHRGSGMKLEAALAGRAGAVSTKSEQ